MVSLIVFSGLLDLWSSGSCEVIFWRFVGSGSLCEAIFFDCFSGWWFLDWSPTVSASFSVFGLGGAHSSLPLLFDSSFVVGGVLG